MPTPEEVAGLRMPDGVPVLVLLHTGSTNTTSRSKSPSSRCAPTTWASTTRCPSKTDDRLIRPRRPDDLDALADVLVRVHALNGYPVEGVEHPRAWLTPPRQLAAWTALVSDTPVGRIALVKANRDDDAAAMWLRSQAGGGARSVAILVRLFVDPEYRGSAPPSN